MLDINKNIIGNRVERKKTAGSKGSRILPVVSRLSSKGIREAQKKLAEGATNTGRKPDSSRANSSR